MLVVPTNVTLTASNDDIKVGAIVTESWKQFKQYYSSNKVVHH